MQLSAVPNQMGTGVSIDTVVTRVQAGQSRFWFLADARVSPFPKMPSPALGPKQSPVRWVLGIFSRDVKWPMCEIPTDLHVVSKLRMNLHFCSSCIPSWYVQGKFTFLPYQMKWWAYLLPVPRHMPVGHVCPMAQSPSQRSRDRMRLWYEDSIRWHCSASCDSSARLGYLSFSRRRSWNQGC